MSSKIDDIGKPGNGRPSWNMVKSDREGFVDSSVGILEDIVRSTRGSSFSSRKRRRTYSSHALAQKP